MRQQKINQEIYHYNDISASIKEVSKYELLRQYLPYIQVLSDGKTIFTKNNTLIRAVKIIGFDSSNISTEEMENISNMKDNLFSFMSEKIHLNFYTIRRKFPEIDEEENLFKNKYANEINKIWNSGFQDSFISEIYLTISCNFPDITKKAKYFKANLNAARKDLDNYVAQVKSLLHKFIPIDLNNRNHNELFKFYSYLINCYDFNNKNEEELFNQFSLSDISFNSSNGLIKIFNDKVKKYSKIIGVKINPKRSDQNLFTSLLTSHIEFTIIQQVKAFNKEQSRKIFLTKRENLEQLPQFSAIQTRIGELMEASEIIDANIANFLDYSCYIKIFADSEDELDDNVSDIHNALANEGVTSLTENIAVIPTFFSLLPDLEGILGNLQTSIRSKITNYNVSDFVSLSSNKEGFRRCPFGEYPVADFKTHLNSSYSFTFHLDDISDVSVGHAMVFGGTGSGKSTLMAFLLMNCLKYDNIKILAFDSKQGLKIPFTAFDGKYITVGKDTDLKLNPMTLPESFANKNFQERFISDLSGGAEEKEMDTIREVIRLNYTLNPEDRSLKNLQTAFGKSGTYKENGRQSIAARMKKWTNAKDKSIYANFFNSPEDNLDFSSNIVCFDMGDTINNPDLLSPVADYIFHKFNEKIASNPSPHIFFVDEMQRYLDSKEFNPSIIRTIKESRKANGIFIGCMQNPSNLIEHEKGGEIIENLATLIIFPNSKARPEHYIDKLNLNDNEFNFVKTCTNPRNVLIKKTGGHSVILDVDLSSLGQHLKLFLSGDKDRAEVQKLINIHQDNWIDEYLKSGAEC